MLTLFGCCTTNDSTQRALIGKWQSQVGQVTYEFLANGTYVYTSPQTPNSTRTGNYAIESRNLLVLTETNGSNQALEFFLRDDVLNVILTDGNISKYTRIR
jgi:hypothetical protein